MSPLPPPPPSAKPPMAQPRRKTSLRTVPKQVQKQFAERLDRLGEDPLQVFPEVVGPMPKPLAKLRGRLERIAAGKAGLLLRRDTGVAGAVVRSLAMRGKPVPTRMLDMKVGGQRRFFVPRGQVERSVMAAVQNHDHAPTLLMAFRSMAKKHELHFFAAPKLWCTGAVPAPPVQWMEALQQRAGITLDHKDDAWQCPHAAARVVLGFRGGPGVEVCANCGATADNMHRLLTTRYAGPRQRQPVEVHVRAPDGAIVEPPREAVAEYRAGVKSEGDLVRTALAGWSPEGQVWMVGDTIHTALEDWLDALSPNPWERKALAAMAREGFRGKATTVSEVLDELHEAMPLGLKAILGRAPSDFLAQHQGQGLRDVLRAAHVEAERAARTAALPRVRSGPVGQLLDEVARSRLAGGRQEALDVVRRRLGQVPDLHAAAIIAALGGDVSLESRIGHADREAAAGLAALAEAVMAGQGASYAKALEAYLRESGSGERVQVTQGTT